MQQNNVNQDLLSQATKKCVSLHTDCKSTLGLCKNRKYTLITQSERNYAQNYKTAAKQWMGAKTAYSANIIHIV